MQKAFGLVVMAALLCCSIISHAGTPTQWFNTIGSNEPGGGFSVGAFPGQQDGYDGQSPVDYTSGIGVWMLLYRANGADWTGPTGLYAGDLQSPIPDGGSKTWWDICLFSYNYTPRLGNQVAAGCTWGSSRPPAGYTGVLTLDYVPTSLNWTGPTEFIIDLNQTTGFYLPCPITDDPFNPENVTRMHLTVYTYPVPEPSSLAGIGFALASLGAGALRRRRK